MKMLKILAVSLVVLALAAGPVLAAGSQPQPQTVCPVLGGISIKKSMSITRGSVSTSAAPAVPRNSKKTRKNT